MANLLTPNGSDFHLTQAPDTARFRSIITEGDTMKLTVLAAVAVLALAGCGGGGAPLTMAEVAAQVGCSDMKAGDVQIYTKEAATCTKGGQDVYLYTFADDGARDNWMKTARAAGGPGTFQQGTSWIAQSIGTASAPTSTPVVAHGPEAYLVWAKAAAFGTKDFAAATDDQLMGVGNEVCGVLSTQPSFGNAVQLMVKMGGNPSVGEAEALVKEAVLDLCPQYKSLVP